MVATSSKVDDHLLIDGSNFSAWYRTRDPQQPFPIKQALHERLSETLSGFESLRFSRSAEDDWTLKTSWNAELGANAFKFELRFDELSDGQRMLIASHHPELINAWVSTNGIRFQRQAAGPIRAARFKTHQDDPLTPAERIARGWDDDDVDEDAADVAIEACRTNADRSQIPPSLGAACRELRRVVQP